MRDGWSVGQRWFAELQWFKFDYECETHCVLSNDLILLPWIVFPSPLSSVLMRNNQQLCVLWRG